MSNYSSKFWNEFQYLCVFNDRVFDSNKIDVESEYSNELNGYNTDYYQYLYGYK